MNVRLNKAKLLLHSTDMTVDEIADSLNFYDTAYFCKIFKKQTGYSPKEYAKIKSL
jgi:two-component system response regulator YesN